MLLPNFVLGETFYTVRPIFPSDASPLCLFYCFLLYKMLTCAAFIGFLLTAQVSLLSESNLDVDDHRT